MTTTRSAIETMLHARSVTIIGASDDGNKASGRTQRYLKKYGFTGSVYPVNPRRETVQGVKSYASVADLPEVPDLAVIVMPQSGVEQAIRECGERGIALAIVFASGYAEVGGAGIELQESLTRTARESGVRVVGPNGNGAVFAASRLTAGFMTGLDQDRWDLKDEGIAFVSQSGAMGAFILSMAQANGLGVGRFVSTGNEIDLTMPVLMKQLAEEGSTRVILGYVEGIRDGQAFLDALRAADEQDVPVCLMKVGRSQRGAEAAASHTGSLAGADTVYEGVFRRHGVQRAESVEGLLDLGRVFASDRRPKGPGTTIVTLSGGAGVLMTDYADELGLDVFPWQGEWYDQMVDVLPSYASSANPIDATGAIATNPAVLESSVTLSLQNPATDLLMLVLGNMDSEEERVCESIIKLVQTSEKPVLVTWVGGSGRPVQWLNEARIPAFTDPVRAMRAAAALVRWSTRRTAAAVTPRADIALDPTVLTAGKGVRYLDEVAAKQLLAQAGIATVDELAVHSADEATKAADEIGFPVVLKLLSQEVAHKTELGVVKVGLRDSASVAAAAEHILDVARREGLEDRRIVVQQMVSSDTEIILGSVVDPVFGPVTMLGIGGVLAEVLSDVQVRPSPVGETEAQMMIDDLRGVALLRGARNRRPVDEHELARTVVAFSELSYQLAHTLESLEINPLLVDGDGIPVAVDALAVLRTDRSGRENA